MGGAGGERPFQEAVKYGHAEIVGKMIAHRTYHANGESNGFHPLEWAVIWAGDDCAIVKILLDVEQEPQPPPSLLHVAAGEAGRDSIRTGR